MPIFKLDDLTTPLTPDEVRAKIYDVIGILGTRTTSWKPGAVARTIITSCALILAAFSELTALIARSGFLELAEGTWLALVAWYVYGVEKDVATFASGEVTLVNAGGGIYILDPDDLIVANPDTGKQYRNASAVTLAANTTQTVTVRAIEAGSSSSSAPNTIVELITPLLGVTVSNAFAVVGRDDETDAALRARCSEKLGSLSPFGPWDAYTYAARTAARLDGSLVGVTRVRTIKDGAGHVDVYVATASGGVLGTVTDRATDLGAVEDAIQRRAAPLAVTARVYSAATVPIAIKYKASMYNTSGLTQSQIETAIANRLADFMAGQPIGGNVAGAGLGKVFLDAIETAIGSTFPQIFHVEASLPLDDVSLSISQVPVLGAVTSLGITQAPPSEGSL